MFSLLLKGYFLLPLACLPPKILRIAVQPIIMMTIFFVIYAKESLFKMLKSPNCIDGCKLVSMQQTKTFTHFRKCTSTLVCSHGVVMNDIDQSQFHPDSVGKSNVPIQRLKCTKSRGSVMKGELFLL